MNEARAARAQAAMLGLAALEARATASSVQQTGPHGPIAAMALGVLDAALSPAATSLSARLNARFAQLSALPSPAAERDLNAMDALVAAFPLALSDDGDDARLATAALDLAALTHGQLRAAVATAFWLGGLSALTTDKATLDAVCTRGDEVAQAALRSLGPQARWTLDGSALQTQGALGLTLAALTQAADAYDLLPPPGYDVRDAPERMVCAALRAAFAPKPWEVAGVLASRPADGVALSALAGATVGFKVGPPPPATLTSLSTANALKGAVADACAPEGALRPDALTTPPSSLPAPAPRRSPRRQLGLWDNKERT